MPLSVAAQVYCLVRDFALRSTPETEISCYDLRHIGAELDVVPSLNELAMLGVLSKSAEGTYTRRLLERDLP